MKEITVQELKNLIDTRSDYQLIDVREQYEVDAAHLFGIHIPMAEVMDNLNQIDRDKKVIIHCRSGKRSAAICEALEAEGFDNVYNLKGGIMAYAQEIDNTLQPV